MRRSSFLTRSNTLCCVLILITVASAHGATAGDSLLNLTPANSLFCVRINNLAATLSRGESITLHGQSMDRRALLLKAIELDRNYAEAYYSLGNLAAKNKEKERAETYLEISGVMMIAINSEGIVTMINSKGCEILGYDESEIVGKNWFDMNL